MTFTKVHWKFKRKSRDKNSQKKFRVQEKSEQRERKEWWEEEKTYFVSFSISWQTSTIWRMLWLAARDREPTLSWMYSFRKSSARFLTSLGQVADHIRVCRSGCGENQELESQTHTQKDNSDVFPSPKSNIDGMLSMYNYKAICNVKWNNASNSLMQ